MKTVHRADERGQAQFPGLDARYSFSFANYYNPERLGFGALRVLNNDIVAPGMGFPPHSHKDFEIITIPLRGAVMHKDSMGNEGNVTVGECQTMSAGAGVTHSEMNESDSEELELLQIWIETAERGIDPHYDQYSFSEDDLRGRFHTLASDTEGAKIFQNASIKRAVLDSTEEQPYEIEQGRGVFLFLILGEINVAGEHLYERDSIEISEDGHIFVHAVSGHADVLLIDVPLSA